jgi:hypothetical protein
VRSPRGQTGQATVDSLAAVPVLLVAGTVCLQLLATGYSLSLADGAAEAGAMALAAGLPPRPAVVGALPGWARDRVSTDLSGGRLTVSVRPPSPLPAVARGLEVRSSAWVRRPSR